MCVCVCVPYALTSSIEEDWERELEAELHDFEVVPEKTTSGGGGGGGGSNVNWEKDMDRLLDDDGEHLDLK